MHSSTLNNPILTLRSCWRPRSVFILLVSSLTLVRFCLLIRNASPVDIWLARAGTRAWWLFPPGNDLGKMTATSCRHTVLSYGSTALLVRGRRHQDFSVLGLFLGVVRYQNCIACLSRWECTILWLVGSLQRTTIHQICERNPVRLLFTVSWWLVKLCYTSHYTHTW